MRKGPGIHRTLLSVGALLVFFSLPMPARAEVSVKAEVDQAFATIGDQINFRVTAVHDPEETILSFNLGNALSDFEIKQSTDFSTREGKKVAEGKNFVITNYVLGDYVIRPLTVQYRDKSGNVKELKTNSLYITIESVDKNKKSGKNEDIRGIKGVQKIKPKLWPWVLFFAALVGIAAGAYFFFQNSRHRLLEKTAREEILSPHDEAYQALNQLQYSDLIRKGQMKLYFLKMSEILRRYFERRYQMHVLESTTFELKNNLKDKTSVENLKLIDEVLSFCDLVKFAKYVPSPLEIIRQNSQAKQIIDQTREQEIQAELPGTGSK